MNVYDLSGDYKAGIWDYGTPYVPYNKKPLATLEKNGYLANQYIITGHIGTHVECIAHWKENVPGIDQEPVENFVGNAKVLKLPESIKCISVEALQKAGAEELNTNDICILVTGWDKYWDTKEYVMESPYLSTEAAKYLAQKNIKLVAMDTPMIGDPKDGIEKVDDGIEVADLYFLDKGINILLGLKNASMLPEEVFFVAVPLKLNGGEGSPVRAIAIEQ